LCNGQSSVGGLLFANRLNRTDYLRILLYNACCFTLTHARDGVLNARMPRAIRRQILNIRGWALLVGLCIAAVVLAWTAAYVCVQLMSG